MTRRRGITDKRQVQFRLLTPRQNPANIRWFVSLVIKHLLIIRVTKNSFLLCNASPHIKGDSILASRHYCTSVLSTGRHTHTHRGVRTPQEPSSNLTGKTTVGKQPVLLKTPVSRRAKRLGSRPDRRARGVPGQGTPPWGTGRGTRRPGAAAHQAGPGRAGQLPAPRQAAGRDGSPDRAPPPSLKRRPAAPSHPPAGAAASRRPTATLPGETPADLGPPSLAPGSCPRRGAGVRREGEGAAVQRGSPSPASRAPPLRAGPGRAGPGAAFLRHAAPAQPGPGVPRRGTAAG